MLVFLGAGASAHFNIPTMTKMAGEVERYIKNECKDEEIELYGLIKENLSSYKDWDIEALLVILEDLSDKNKLRYRFEHPSTYWLLKCHDQLVSVGKWIEKDLNSYGEIANELKNKIREPIVQLCGHTDLSKEKLEAYTNLFASLDTTTHLKAKIEDARKRGEYVSSTAEIFTTNYDYCLEGYCRRMRITFNDGRRTVVPGREIIDISPSNDRLYGGANIFHIFKLHGSSNWYRRKGENTIYYYDPEVTKLSREVVEGEAMIYPTHEKYIYRDPFYDMFHHFKNRLAKSEMVIVIGFSFRDEEIRDVLVDTIKRRERKQKETTVFFVDPKAKEIKDEKLKEIESHIEPIPKKFGEVDFTDLFE